MQYSNANFGSEIFDDYGDYLKPTRVQRPNRENQTFRIEGESWKAPNFCVGAQGLWWFNLEDGQNKFALITDQRISDKSKFNLFKKFLAKIGRLLRFTSYTKGIFSRFRCTRD